MPIYWALYKRSRRLRKYSILGYNCCIKGREKCPKGGKHISECSLINNACQDNSKPYLYSNGECIDDILKCPHADTPGECIYNKVRCPTGRRIEII